jgi:Zn-dependent M28 family amino/carboxypeptidase
VAILLELARSLPDRVPEEVELVFLSTGAEEDHMVGAMRWLDANREELLARPTLAINLDGAGNPGSAVLLESYGCGQRLAPTLSRLARSAARRLDIAVRGVYLPPALGVDAIPFVHRGVECLTLASGSLNRATLSVHSKNDVAENLDGPTLEKVARLAVGIVDEVVASAPDGRRADG